MAKKRDPRLNTASTRRRNRVDPSSQHLQPINSAASADNNGGKNRRLFIIFVISFIASSAISLLIHRHIKDSPPATASYVYEKGLVKTDVNFHEILTENSRVSENVTQRQFTNPILAYITPWNSGGYELAKRFISKFTHLSPVWYDLKSQGTELLLEGRHNADTGWLSELRLRGNAQVLPRVVIEALPKDLLRKKKLRDKAIDLIITECKDMDYDGVVLESWSRWAFSGVLHDAALRKLALQFIKQLGDSLHNVSSPRTGEHLQLVYVIGPPSSEKLQAHDFGPEDIRTVSEFVDGFSLMTYDYSSPYSPGPNAPLEWVHSTLKLLLGAGSKSLGKKMFVGINFYGHNFLMADGGGAAWPITGREYLSLLEKYEPAIKWGENFAEHFFMYYDDEHRQHAVFYPTVMSISKRLEEARSWGAGIAIWEIGQGLNYFFDLL